MSILPVCLARGRICGSETKSRVAYLVASQTYVVLHGVLTVPAQYEEDTR